MRFSHLFFCFFLISIPFQGQAHTATAPIARFGERYAGARAAAKIARKHPYITAGAFSMAALIWTMQHPKKTQNAEATDAEREAYADDNSETRMCVDTYGSALNSMSCSPGGATAFDESLDGASPSSSRPDGHIVFRKNSAILTDNMEGALDADQAPINPKKPQGCAAHHIVMAAQWKQSVFVQESQRFLSECHIDINSFWNGVYLPNFSKNDPAFSRASLPLACRFGNNHRYLHTDAYKQTVFNRLQAAYQKDLISQNKAQSIVLAAPVAECENVKIALLKIKTQLQTGTFK